MNKVDGPYTSRISLYLKVANILRSRIIKGQWQNGDRLPSISALCQEFQVGRVTIRQALHLLSAEGLVISSRGRGTYVSSDIVPGQVQTKLASRLQQSSQKTRILSISGPAPLPRTFLGEDQAFTNYHCIRKLRYHNETPYCLMDIYVTSPVFLKFAESELQEIAVASLVSDHSEDPIAYARQTLTVGSADYEASQLLECSMAAPIAEMDRAFLNGDGFLLSRGHYLYRGDLFLMETEHEGDPLSDMPSGWMPDVRND